MCVSGSSGWSGKFRGPEAYEQQILTSHSPGGRKSTVTAPAGLLSAGNRLPTPWTMSPRCVLTGGAWAEGEGVAWGPVIRALLQAWGSTLATPLTSQRPRLLTPSPWGWDFSMWILGTHLDHSRLWRAAWQPVHSWRPLRPAHGPERVLRCRGLCSGLA